MMPCSSEMTSQNLDPIWLPHCPACTWTISLMAMRVLFPSAISCHRQQAPLGKRDSIRAQKRGETASGGRSLVTYLLQLAPRVKGQVFAHGHAHARKHNSRDTPIAKSLRLLKYIEFHCQMFICVNKITNPCLRKHRILLTCVPSIA